jgi:hypothetical protein
LILITPARRSAVRARPSIDPHPPATRIVPMRLVHRLLLAGLPLAWTALSASEARACSLSGFPTSRSPDGVHFIATATADTLFAGPGAVRYEVAPGHFGAPGDRTVYGQVVEVERAGGATARVPGRFTRAVVVPWDYGADCRPTPWTRSARWVEPGTRGLYVASLRDPAHWVDGIPTFDVHTPDSDPFPQHVEPWRLEDEEGGTLELLTADQTFALMDLLPLRAEEDADPRKAARPLLEWARANPALARRYPATEILHYVRAGAESDMLGEIDPPLAGTYRFTATLAGRAPVTFFARTRSAPTTEWDPSPVPTQPDDPTEPRRPTGYTMLAAGAPTAESLPVDVGATRRMDREGYFSVLMEPERMADGTQVWRGSIDVELVARQFPADPVIGQFAKDDFERFRERIGKELPEETRARFVLAPDGSVRAEQTTDLGGGRVLTIRAERISRDVIPNPR